MILAAQIHPNAVSGQFWPTIAQVVPVLAIAVVLEARTLIQRWPDDFPQFLRRLNGFIWTVTLLLAALAENFAIRLLAGGVRSTAGWVSLSEVSVTESVIVLFLGPALDLLFRSNARVLLLLTFHASTFYGRRNLRRLSSNAKKVLVESSELRYRTIPSWLAHLDESELRVRRIVSKKEREELLNEIDGTRKQIVEARKVIQNLYQLALDQKALSRKWLREMRRPDASALSHAETAITREGFGTAEISLLLEDKFPVDEVADINRRMRDLTKRLATGDLI